MARYDVYLGAKGSGLLLDCQADILSDLRSRLVVPLLGEAEAGKPMSRLNPIFVIQGERYVMVTQFAAAIEVRELGEKRASLAAHDAEIGAALDLLLTGI